MYDSGFNLKKPKFKLANLLEIARGGTMDHVPELMQEKHVPLTLADRAVLDQRLKTEERRLVGVALLAGLLYGWFGWVTNEWWGVFISLWLVAFIAAVAHSVLDIGASFKQDLAQGEKTVLKGQVYQTSRTYGRSPTFYFHLSPKIRLETSEEWYYRLELGQKVEVHVAPLSRLVLELKLRPEGDS
jgi:hypothetical protein